MSVALSVNFCVSFIVKRFVTSALERCYTNKLTDLFESQLSLRCRSLLDVNADANANIGLADNGQII